MEKPRLNDGKIVCKKCGSSEKIYKINDGEKYKCAKCRKQFTVRVGTIFEDSPLPLQKWYMGLFLITAHKKGISSWQLSCDLEITQKSARFMQSPPPEIVAYNELRSCADLLRMATASQLEIDPDFQRGFVWKPADQKRFIDSLIKGLPIPSLCISYDFQMNTRLVIDGRQRITTIINFLSNPLYRLSTLDDIDPRIAGQTVTDLRKNKETSQLYEKVQNVTIPVTVIRYDTTNRNHMQYLFKIFHRLNSGGAKLSNQEIRNGIYNGEFNTFLKEITNEIPVYTELMKMKKGVNYRFAYEELNLRFFALYDGLDSYDGKLSKFLNDYMYRKSEDERINPEMLDSEIEEKRSLFIRTTDVISQKIFDSNPMDHLSKAIIEALFISVCSNIDILEDTATSFVKGYFKKMQADPQFSAASLKAGIGKKVKVQGRINKAIEIFAGN